MVRLRYPRLGVLAMELLLTPPKVGVGVYSPVARLSGYLAFVCWLVCLCRRSVGVLWLVKARGVVYGSGVG